MKNHALAVDPQARITWGSVLAESPFNPPVDNPHFKILHGFDTLRLSFWIAWPEPTGDGKPLVSLLDQIDEAKHQAQEKDLSFIPMTICGHEWNVHRTGTKQYNCHISRGDMHLLFNRRNHHSPIPNTRLEIGSVACWSGHRAVYQHALEIIEFFGGFVFKERVSEAHLCADLIGVDIKTTGFADMDLWVCRAHSFSSHFQHKQFSGLSQGKGNIMVRCYDKVMELKRETHKQKIFAEIWGFNSFDDDNVTRVEFQLRRPALKDFKDQNSDARIDTLSDMEQSLTAIWRYLTSLWCRHTSDTVDRKNRHQDTAKVSPIWQQIQSVIWTGVKHILRTKKYLLKDLDRLIKQLVGVGMTISACIGVDPTDPEDVAYESIHALRSGIKSLAESEPEEFRRRMMVKYLESIGPLEPAPF